MKLRKYQAWTRKEGSNDSFVISYIISENAKTAKADFISQGREIDGRVSKY